MNCLVPEPVPPRSITSWSSMKTQASSLPSNSKNWSSQEWYWKSAWTEYVKFWLWASPSFPYCSPSIGKNALLVYS